VQRGPLSREQTRRVPLSSTRRLEMGSWAVRVTRRELRRTGDASALQQPPGFIEQLPRVQVVGRPPGDCRRGKVAP
jgi:hypothetical protein